MPTQNGVMMQYFHWYSPADGTLWERGRVPGAGARRGGLHRRLAAARLQGSGRRQRTSATGSTTCTTSASSTRRARSAPSTGRGSSTWPRSQALQKAGLQVYADTVLNHRMGGDATEVVRATPFPQDDRLRPRGETREIEAYTHFRLPGPKGEALDVRVARPALRRGRLRPPRPRREEHRLPDRGQAASTTGWRSRAGTSPTVMGAERRLREPGGPRRGHGLGQVVPRHDGGRRLPPRRGQAPLGLVLAPSGSTPWRPTRRRTSSSWRTTGRPTVGALHSYLDRLGGRITLFGVPLHYHFHHASRAGGHYDMRRLLDGTLMQQRGRDVVTFVENHDSQPLQAARVGGRALVQAARLRARPAAARGLPLRLLRRLLRGRVRGPGPGRPHATGS